MKNIKQEKGITLIALVITIIVLLILAGVAISMLSGENGILNQAAESKEKTESESFVEKVRIAIMGAMTNKDAEIKESDLATELDRVGIKKENIINYGNGEYIITNGTEKVTISKNGKAENGNEIKDIDIELQKYFNEKKLDYKCKYGYVTGIEFGTTVDQMNENLKEGEYEIISKYQYNASKSNGTDADISGNENIATGMVIAKDGKEVARTVLFGDFNCDGALNASDGTMFTRYLALYNIIDIKDFQKIAMNIYADNEINTKDRKLLSEWMNSLIEPQVSITTPAKNIKILYTELHEYINSLDNKETGYSFEYNEETDTYKLKGVKEGTTVENLINSLPQKDNVSVIAFKSDGSIGTDNISGESIVEDGYYLRLKLAVSENLSVQTCFAYIETEKTTQ